MEINDTLQLSSIEAPKGVTFVIEEDEEVTIATLSPPRVEEAAPAIETGDRAGRRVRRGDDSGDGDSGDSEGE